MAGWIYVMSNPAMPGLLKIGRSSREPKGDRAAELSKATGVPQPFEVEYQALVDDESREEKRLHKHFQSKRVNGKEFFEGLTVPEVVEAVHSLCTIKYEDNFHQTKADQAKFEAERKRQRERREKQAEDDLRRRKEQEEQERRRQEREKEKLERQRRETRLIIFCMVGVVFALLTYPNELKSAVIVVLSHFIPLFVVGPILGTLALLAIKKIRNKLRLTRGKR